MTLGIKTQTCGSYERKHIKYLNMNGCFKKNLSGVVHTCNPSTQRGWGRSTILSLRPTWPTYWVPGPPGIHSKVTGVPRPTAARRAQSTCFKMTDDTFGGGVVLWKVYAGTIAVMSSPAFLLVFWDGSCYICSLGWPTNSLLCSLGWSWTCRNSPALASWVLWL